MTLSFCRIRVLVLLFREEICYGSAMSDRKHFLAFAVLLSATIGIGNLASGMTVPPVLKKTVAFVFVPKPDKPPQPNGTCFFVSIADKEHANRTWIYAVTAKHVLESSPGFFYPRIWIRFNKKDGGTESPEIPVNLTGPNKTVFLSVDE